MGKKRVNVVTMGCSKNLVDSEILLGQLQRDGFSVFSDSNELPFDAVIINTCGFIHDAKQESIDMILDYLDAKSRGDIRRLYVMGCLSERYRQELEEEIPEVDRYFGKFEIKALMDELEAEYQPEWIYQRKITTPSHYAYLKVSEGCNRTCAFCAIPMMTGRQKSRPVEDLVREAHYLAQNGVRELLLIAQDLSNYGTDIYKGSRLPELIKRLSGIEGIAWIRLHYLYPVQFPEEVLTLMHENPKVCRYLDMPLQHITTPVLKRMIRGINHEQTVALVRRIKKSVPGIAFRTTMLVGFPGETEADFEMLKQFVRETKFDRLGVFPYSHEEKTIAAGKYEDDVPPEIKQRRVDEIMEIQRSISAELNQKKTGKTFRVIVDRREGDYFIGRTEFDSPGVDGEVFISSAIHLREGDFCDVRITRAEDYDLWGEVISASDDPGLFSLPKSVDNR